MKHLIKSAILLLALLPATAAAYDFEVDGIYYNINGNEASVTFGTNKYSGDVTIPEAVTHNGMTYPVTHIGNYAFDWCTGLTSISIPNSVTSIGEEAFDNCSGLTCISIPNSVTTIGWRAFGSCGLTSLTIPNSVTRIGSGAFGECSCLESITVDSGNPKFDSRNHCNAIIETSNNTLIAGCKNSVIPNSVTTIDYMAFEGNTGLTSLSIPNSVTDISNGAFNKCSRLGSIIVESGNPRYDSRNNCNAIIETSSNTLIAGCRNTVIPNSITTIGDYAFSGLPGLTFVTLPNSVTTIGEAAFAECIGLNDITIPNSVTTIGDYAFYRCLVMQQVTIPNSVTSIGNYAFYWCSALNSIIVESGNPTYDSRKNCNAIIETSSNTLIVGCMNTIIPNTVTTIGEAAFAQCSNLHRINIPNSVTAIGDDAFAWCYSLYSVYCYINDPSAISMGKNVFNKIGYDELYPGCVLYVPYGTANAYQANRNWYPCFWQIVEMDNETVLRGDVNGDGDVNISDINVVVNIILGATMNDETMERADVNGDHQVNIADLNEIINIILGGGTPTSHDVETITVNGVSFKMVKVECGTFTMGASDDDPEANDTEKPAHQVTLTKDYAIGQTEVTQALWLAVMGSNPSSITGDLNLPVEQVSWNSCQTFIAKLNELTGKSFRLPTEAEWEFAARGGKKSKGYKYAGSDSFDAVAWVKGNCGSTTHPVGSKSPNELGIYDMSGNVWEWCQDIVSYYSSSEQVDPTGPTAGYYYILRGGGWRNDEQNSRVTNRSGGYPTNTSPGLGLRLAL